MIKNKIPYPRPISIISEEDLKLGDLVQIEKLVDKDLFLVSKTKNSADKLIHYSDLSQDILFYNDRNMDVLKAGEVGRAYYLINWAQKKRKVKLEVYEPFVGEPSIFLETVANTTIEVTITNGENTFKLDEKTVMSNNLEEVELTLNGQEYTIQSGDIVKIVAKNANFADNNLDLYAID